MIWLIIGLLAIAWTLWYHRTPLWLWSLCIVAGLALWHQLDPAHLVPRVILAAILLPPLLILQIPSVRRRVITSPIFRLFRSQLPPMSATEREALEAGTVWWDRELFSGAPRWKKLFKTPRPHLTADEQAFLDGPVEKLCQMLDDWEITHERLDLPQEVWRFMRREKLFGMIIPREYGGLGLSALAHSHAVMKVASRSITAAVTVMVPNSLGPAELLLRYGTTRQREYYLPRLARGDEIPCFALTSPQAGSDASSLPDRGVVCRADHDGQEDVLGIRVNWEKRYITLGPVATVIGLAFHLYDPDHLLGPREDLGITLALIPTGTPGVEVGRRHFPLNIPFQNGPTTGTDVFIPLDWVIGGRDGVGQGWRMLMECLAAGRAISLPSLATGAGKLACRGTGAYARIRRQFHQPIGRFEGVQEALARIAGYTYQCDAVRKLTAAVVDHGEQPAVLSAIAKYNLTEKMRRIVNDAMDVQGGSGICLGPRNFLGRVYQAVPIGITVEGANILTRSMIIFGQGAIRCHPWILEEMEAARDPDRRKGLARFDRALFRHAGFFLSNLARSLWLGLTDGRGSRIHGPDPERRILQQLTRMSSVFALLADSTMLMLGGALKRRESLSGRLADALGQLYIASACLKRFHDHNRPAEDVPLLRWACEDALWETQEALLALLDNLPVPVAGRLLRLVTFPRGRTCRPPSDRLVRQVAEVILEPGEARSRLTAGLFIPSDLSNPLALIDQSLGRVVAAEEVERTLRHLVRSGQLDAEPEESLPDRAVAGGLITPEEAQRVRLAEAARREVIRVDDFPQDLSAFDASARESSSTRAAG